jgi:hypothetical protein
VIATHCRSRLTEFQTYVGDTEWNATQIITPIAVGVSIISSCGILFVIYRWKRKEWRQSRYIQRPWAQYWKQDAIRGPRRFFGLLPDVFKVRHRERTKNWAIDGMADFNIRSSETRLGHIRLPSSGSVPIGYIPPKPAQRHWRLPWSRNPVVIRSVPPRKGFSIDGSAVPRKSNVNTIDLDDRTPSRIGIENNGSQQLRQGQDNPDDGVDEQSRFLLTPPPGQNFGASTNMVEVQSSSQSLTHPPVSTYMTSQPPAYPSSQPPTHPPSPPPRPPSNEAPVNPSTQPPTLPPIQLSTISVTRSPTQSMHSATHSLEQDSMSMMIISPSATSPSTLGSSPEIRYQSPPLHVRSRMTDPPTPPPSKRDSQRSFTDSSIYSTSHFFGRRQSIDSVPSLSAAQSSSTESPTLSSRNSQDSLHQSFVPISPATQNYSTDSLPLSSTHSQSTDANTPVTISPSNKSFTRLIPSSFEGLSRFRSSKSHTTHLIPNALRSVEYDGASHLYGRENCPSSETLYAYPTNPPEVAT